jgi:hypothetical protein
MRLLALFSLLILGIGAGLAQAAETSGGGSGGSDPTPLDPPTDRDRNTGSANLSGRSEPAGVFVQGHVTDSAGRALEAIKVKLFSGGFLISATQTDAEGRFKISSTPVAAQDRPLDLWFASPDSRWVDASVALAANSESNPSSIRPACTPVIPLLGGAATLEIKMLTFEERREEVSRLRCLESARKN